jgi:hypothetical protein
MSLIFSILTDLSRAWELRYIPAPSQRFDQQYARVHSPPKNVHIVALVFESYGLCSEDLKIRISSANVTIGKYLQGLLDRFRCLALLLCLALENAKRREIVFYLLKGGQRGLTVVCDCCVIVGLRHLGIGPSSP